MDNINLIILGTAGVVAALFVIMIFAVKRMYDQYRNSNVKIYEMVNDRFKEKRQLFFDYNKTNSFLESNGAKYHYLFMAEPLKYLCAQIIFAAVGFLAGSFFHLGLAALLMVGGFCAPSYLIRSANIKDNEKLLGDMKMIYNSLTAQIKSGIYIGEAVVECASPDVLTNKRLLREMEYFASDIVINSNIIEATENFVRKFDNSYISSLGVVITQAVESGKATEALEDISDQLKELDKGLLRLKNEKKQYRNFIFQLLMMGEIVLAIVMTTFPQMMGMITQF